MYDDVSSSPPAALTSVMMVTAIAAKEHRHVIAADIAGAYLNAEMKNAIDAAGSHAVSASCAD